MRLKALFVFGAALSIACLAQAVAIAASTKPEDVSAIVARAVQPVMLRYGIPGMSVGVTLHGRRYIYSYGVASRSTRKPVDSATLFEVGSITKTFTASLASYAQLTGALSLSDKVGSDFLPLRGTSFDRVNLVNLGTHTTGGLPLQFPESVRTDEDALKYYQQWKPSHPAGTYRRYSNPSIMLLGLVAARRMNADFVALMQRVLLAPLGLRHTFLRVPSDQIANYAQGYNDSDVPRRLTPGPLAPQAYGIRTTAPDLLRFIDANMNLVNISPTLQRAINNTHTGYYRFGAMTQDLIWEQYRYPVTLAALLQGNSDRMIFEENVATKLEPPLRPQSGVLLDKTGSTNGFGAYVALVPQQRTGIVLLANKSYPIEARVRLAYRILTDLTRTSPR